jgi:hypothetical protein
MPWTTHRFPQSTKNWEASNPGRIRLVRSHRKIHVAINVSLLSLGDLCALCGLTFFSNVFDPWLLLIRLRPQAALGLSWFRSSVIFLPQIFLPSFSSVRLRALSSDNTACLSWFSRFGCGRRPRWEFRRALQRGC